MTVQDILVAGFSYYVINLDRSKQRWERISQHLNGNGVEPIRISAVDGSCLSDDVIHRHYKSELNKKEYFIPLSTAEVACFLSHMKALRTFVDSYDHSSEIDQYAVILEDDVEFVGDIGGFRKQWQRAMDSETPLMLKIYSKRNVSGKVLFEESSSVVIKPKLVPLGCQGAIFNLAAAKRILSQFETFSMPVDVAYQFWWEHGVTVLVCQPNQLNEISDQVGGSNIARKKSFSWWKVKRELGRSWFRAKLKLVSLYHYLLGH